ncbi:molybdenum cofactor biosynthesis protein 1 [Spodoptera litura]|uniref:Molybdenum cofactor biosynthesis protein 1 n=1 Tax=Spodoptera litura TaxID=69820 RepID=A0A9J7EUY2_SPOLT|nr:molybdenum cofactor biosynthesis protein 1 [Spodoptera litura]
MMRVNLNKIISLARISNLELSFLAPRARLLDGLHRSFANEPGSTEVAPAPAQLVEPPLVDSFGRRHNYLRISLTERCNLRCQYCMPAEGVPLSARGALLSRAELLRLARVFVAAGVDKVRLTGGEPTLRADLADVVRGLREAGVRAVGMTTNGLVLTRRLPALQRAGLSALNVSLDSLRADRYERMARRPGLARVLAGVDLALQLGYSPVKINVVLMKGFNDDEISDFVEYTMDRDVEVRFIEFMPFSGNRWDDSKLVPYRAALAAARARHVCLFGAAEVSLRDAARAGASDAALTALVRAALRNKKARHAGTCSPSTTHCDWDLFHKASSSTYIFRNGESGPHGEPSDDPHRRLACLVRPATGPARPAPGPALLSDVERSQRGLQSRASGRWRRASRSRGRRPRSPPARGPRWAPAPTARAPRTTPAPSRTWTAAGARAWWTWAPSRPLALDAVRVRVELPRGACEAGGALRVRCEARATARTGVEMEALTGCAVAALALYDMCKSVDRSMRISELRVVQKSGGRSDVSPAPPPPLRAPDRSPLGEGETYAPTNVMHF